jgi:hypothetical protein
MIYIWKDLVHVLFYDPLVKKSYMSFNLMHWFSNFISVPHFRNKNLRLRYVRYSFVQQSAANHAEEEQNSFFFSCICLSVLLNTDENN